jgi:uncharacterized protein
MKIPSPQITKIKITSEALHEMQILHLSDLHINTKTTPKDIEALVKVCHAIEYDFIALTGDIIDCNPSKIKPQLMILNNLKNVYFISGNHDLFYGLKTLKKILNNFTYLDNDTTFITFQEKKIALAGLSDRFSKFFHIKREEKKVVEFLKNNPDSILIAHQPKDYTFALQSQTKLFLCGHTHGGQIFPFHYLVRLVQPFVAGLFYKEQTAIYVNKGLGTWGIDFRYKAKNEITLLQLEHSSY